MFINRQMDKDVACVYIYMSDCVCVYTHTKGYYSSIKRNDIESFVETWMDLRGCHAE